MRIDVKFGENAHRIPVKMSVDGESFGMGFRDVVQVPSESDHAALTNRDAPDQHPIHAITGLGGELDARPEGEAITNAEIDSIWKTIMGG